MNDKFKEVFWRFSSEGNQDILRTVVCWTFFVCGVLALPALFLFGVTSAVTFIAAGLVAIIIGFIHDLRKDWDE